MSEKNPIRLFVAHGFEASADYLRVFEYLEHASNFFYVNHSNPEAVPATGGLQSMKDALREQMRPAEAVIVVASVHTSAPELLRFQLDCAGALEKPLIAIEPFGGVDPMPEDIAARSDVVVGWNEREIVDAVRLQARHEDTQRWEVIDFP